MEVKDILKNIDKHDYFDKVNLHIHTVFSDGKLTLEDISSNIDSKKYISITDHNTVEAYKEIQSDKIIKGVEFDCWYGYTLLHVLGYGIDTDNKELLELCAKTKRDKEADLFRFFNKRKAPAVIKAIRNAGGVPVLAHPCCYWNLNIKNMIKELKELGLEGVEVYYPYKRHRAFIKFYSVAHIENIADELNMIKTGGSDAHGKVF